MGIRLYNFAINFAHIQVHNFYDSLLICIIDWDYSDDLHFVRFFRSVPRVYFRSGPVPPRWFANGCGVLPVLQWVPGWVGGLAGWVARMPRQAAPQSGMKRMRV